jgi:hypothetical protein
LAHHPNLIAVPLRYNPMQATQVQNMLTPLPADIEFESRLRRTVLVVECKFTTDESAASAARQRNRFVVGDVDVPPGAFFMMAFPTRFHLWRPDASADAPPAWSVDAKPVLRRYLGDVANKVPWPGTWCTRFAVSAWLDALAAPIREPDTSEAEQMLVDTGLYELMKGGSIRSD